MYTIDGIHAAMLAVMKASALKNVCKTIDTYAGEVQDVVDQADQLLITPPAALLLYGGSTFAGKTGLLQDNFNLVIVYLAKDLRGGKDLEAGMYAMIEAGKTLHGSNLGLQISPLKPVAIRMVKVGKTYSIYQHQIQTFFAA